MSKRRNMVWLGPTGCGKSGLATAFLLQAIDRGHRGYFVTFPELLQELFQSLADRSEEKVLKRYLSYDCLVIDEVGYVEVEAAQVGQFFTLMHKRHKQKTTLVTSNLGLATDASRWENRKNPGNHFARRAILIWARDWRTARSRMAISSGVLASRLRAVESCSSATSASILSAGMARLVRMETTSPSTSTKPPST